MFTTSWGWSQVLSKPEHLEGTWVDATSGEEAAVVSKNAELGFLVLFFVQGLSERVGFGSGGDEWSCLDHAGSSWRFQLNTFYICVYIRIPG